MRTGIIVEVTAAERDRLEGIVADRNSPQKHVWRAGIVLATADGLGTVAIMRHAVVFFGRFIAVLRMFAALLAGANSMPPCRFFFFNITGGVCWACLFGFGAYAVGAEIYKISGTLSVISFGLFIAGGYALSIFIRRNEVTLRRRAEAALSDHSCG